MGECVGGGWMDGKIDRYIDRQIDIFQIYYFKFVHRTCLLRTTIFSEIDSLSVFM
jgi:hypothetical protein